MDSPGFPGRLDRLLSTRGPRVAAVHHLVIACLLFSPFFLSGNFILGSTDNFFHHYPNMLFNLKSFRDGHLGLWNPHVLCGIDFSASSHNFMYFPINWLVFSLPAKFFFLAMTMRMFVEVWLVGFLAYLFFTEEFRDRRWALFSSTLFQLSGYLFFSITTYANLTISVFTLLSLYLIWTLDRQKAWMVYAALSLCAASIMLCGNIVYAFSAMSSIAVLYAWRHWPESFALLPPSRANRIVVSALVTGLLLAMVRILPLYHGLLEGGRLEGNAIGGVMGSAYFGVTAFVAETFGIYFISSMPFYQAVSPGNGGHAQFHGFTHFGALAMMLVVLAVAGLREDRARFWLGYLGFSVLWFLVVQPASDIVSLVLYPLNHTIIPKMMIPLPVCAVAGHTGMFLASGRGRIEHRHRRILLFAAVFVVCAIAMMWIYRFGYLLEPVRRTLLGYIGAMLVLAVFLRNRPDRLGRAVASVSFLGILVLLGVIVQSVWIREPGDLMNNLFTLGIFLTSASLLGILTLAGALAWFLKGCPHRRIGFVLLGAVALAFTVVLLYPYKPLTNITISRADVLLLAVGTTRFAAITWFLAALLRKTVEDRLSLSWLLPAFLVIALVDLLPFNKMYSRQITEPFFRGSLYPPRDEFLVLKTPEGSRPLDLASYRVNHPHMILQYAGNELVSNIPSIYGVSSYGGVNSQIGKRYGLLMKEVNPRIFASIAGFNAEETDERFLDLTGCGYDYDAVSGVRIRPRALARFMLFHHAEVITDDERILKRLREPDFDPNRTLILEQTPDCAPLDKPSPAVPIPCTSPAPDEIHLAVDSASPALLLFNDAYHRGWKATADGREIQILRANFNFMAVPVPAGKYDISLEFRPEAFRHGVILTGAGLLILLSAAVFLARRNAV